MLGHGHGSAWLLLTAIGGYWLLERAETHNKKSDLRRAGKLLGWLIIVASLVGVACNVWYLATCKGVDGPMGMGKKGGMFCPFHAQQAPERPSDSTK